MVLLKYTHLFIQLIYSFNIYPLSGYCVLGSVSDSGKIAVSKTKSVSSKPWLSLLEFYYLK